MSQEKMIMGEAPDEDVKSGKSGLFLIVIVVFAIVAIVFFYFKNKSKPTNHENPTDIVQTIPLAEVKTIQSTSVESKKSSVASSDILIEEKQPIVLSQEKKENLVEINQEDSVDSLSMEKQSTRLGGMPSSESEVKTQLSAEIKPKQSTSVESKKSSVASNDILTEEKQQIVLSQEKKENLVEINQEGSMENLPTKNQTISDSEKLPTKLAAKPSLKSEVETQLSVEKASVSISNTSSTDNKDELMKGKELNKNIEMIQTVTSPKKSETIWTVKAGEHLWMISKDHSVFGDPYKWVKIFEANKYQISDANLIYPGQKLIIPN